MKTSNKTNRMMTLKAFNITLCICVLAALLLSHALLENKLVGSTLLIAIICFFACGAKRQHSRFIGY